MAEDARPADKSAGDQDYVPHANPADPNEHQHGSVVHSHQHTGPHAHGDDYEYDEAHDPERGPEGQG